MIDKAFTLALITSDMVTGAIGLFGAACYLFIFVFPHRFVKSTDREGHAAKIGFERLGALLGIACGLALYTNRHRDEYPFSLVKQFFPRAKSRGSGR